MSPAITWKAVFEAARRPGPTAAKRQSRGLGGFSPANLAVRQTGGHVWGLLSG